MSQVVTLKRASIIFAALVATGVLAQVPLVPRPGGWTSLAAVAAAALHLPPERIGYDPVGFLTVRKVITATVFAWMAAIIHGLVRRDAGGRAVAGIPPLSAAAAGLFRIVLGCALLGIFVRVGAVEPALPVAMHRNAGPLADWDWAHALAADDRAPIVVHSMLLAAAAVFAAGLFSRTATVALASLATVHAVILLQRQSAHDWGMPVVTFWLLTLVPWGDALSLDAAWRRYRGLPPTRRSPEQYGLAVWIPGLTLGVAYFAAAFAKLDSSGLAWITDGAVRYHFIEDARQAPFDWGLRIAASDLLARLASGAAVIVESLLILNVFVRDWRVRIAFGAAGAALLLGFYLFQGVFWHLWWVWLLAFVPWQPLAASLSRAWNANALGIRDSGFGIREPGFGLRQAQAALSSSSLDQARDDLEHVEGSKGELRASSTSTRPSAFPLPRWQVLLLGAFMLQQVVFSAVRLEMEPLVSDYGMYSFTWRTRAAFEEHLRQKFRVVRIDSSGVVVVEEPVFDWERGQFAAPRIVPAERP